ncbi:DEAD/DEAH box helicase [Sulfurovum sp.]|uniref:DEAD/DEAH box helicase n=1 Tax=Sulfurovum sp. TaxID=1969726 RepID=UPI002867C4BF|nr:DEAD/DEAH box helicase [Sulfurovum sp.]
MKAFEKLNLHPDILKAVAHEKYDNATAIQNKVIPAAMKGLDILGASKSGTGKTAAFVLPLLNKLQKVVKKDEKVVRALIIVPTIELADQVSRTIVSFSKYLDIQTVKIQGGSKKSDQIHKLRQGVDIIVATPGRLQDFIADKKVNLEHVNTVILDEADTMLELGFLGEIKSILKSCTQPKQMMCFSATISQNIKKLAKEFLRDPAIVEVSNRRDVVNFIKHRAYKVDKKRKAELAAKLVKDIGTEQVLIFVNKKDSADRLFEYFKSQDIWTAIIHGDINRGGRARALTLFKSGRSQVLIATDIAARGIDIPELPLVINYDLPEETDSFTHRVGRTGRANHKGAVITLLTIHDYNAFTTIEKHLKLNVKRDIMDGFEITDKQPRQARPRKKSLSEKKGKIDYDKKRKYTYAAQKKKRQETKKKK